MKLPDEIWQVICETALRYDGIDCNLPGLRDYVEQNIEITLFDGGAFLSDGNEFDVFVVPEKRGKWAIRREINGFLAKLAQRYEKAIVKIHEQNAKSLRLAIGFGFQPVGRNKRNKIVLERQLWVT